MQRLLLVVISCNTAAACTAYKAVLHALQAQHGGGNDDADMISTAGNYLIETLTREEEVQQTIEAVNWGVLTLAVSVAVIAMGYWWRRR